MLGAVGVSAAGGGMAGPVAMDPALQAVLAPAGLLRFADQLKGLTLEQAIAFATSDPAKFAELYKIEPAEVTYLADLVSWLGRQCRARSPSGRALLLSQPT